MPTPTECLTAKGVMIAAVSSVPIGDAGGLTISPDCWHTVVHQGRSTSGVDTASVYIGVGEWPDVIGDEEGDNGIVLKAGASVAIRPLSQGGVPGRSKLYFACEEGAAPLVNVIPGEKVGAR